MAPLMSFLVFFDTLSFLLESLFKFLVRYVDKLLSVRRLTIEFAKARGQIRVIALVRIRQLFIRLEVHIVWGAGGKLHFYALLVTLELAYGRLTRLLRPVTFSCEGANLLGTLSIRVLVTIHRIEAVWRVERHFHFLADCAAIQSFVSGGRAHFRTINFTAVELWSITWLHARLVPELDNWTLLDVSFEVVIHIGYQKILRLFFFSEVHLAHLLGPVRGSPRLLCMHECW